MLNNSLKTPNGVKSPIGFGRRTSLLLVATFLLGCTTPKVIEESIAEMLPNEVAMKILDSNGMAPWVKSPMVKTKGLVCGENFVPIRLEEIDEAIYTPKYSTLALYGRPSGSSLLCAKPRIVFVVRGEKNAGEVVKALVALKAPIKNFSTLEPVVIPTLK